MKKLLIASLFTALLFTEVRAQVSIDWVVRHNSPDSTGDQPTAITVDQAGNIYVTGYSYGFYGGGPQVGFDYATVKYNNMGVQQWEQRYTFSQYSDDRSYDISLDQSGNVFVTGSSDGKATTLKYDLAGNESWSKPYTGTPVIPNGHRILADGSGNVFIAGGGGTHTGLLKYDNNGSLKWAQTYNGGAYGQAFDLSISDSGYIYITGAIAQGATGKDFITLKYDSSGALLWEAIYDGPIGKDDVASSIAVDSLDHVYVAGSSAAIDSTNFDITLVKYDANGNQMWLYRYDGTASKADSLHQMVMNRSGRIFLAGSTMTTGNHRDLILVVTDTAGNFQWLDTYDQNGSRDEATSVFAAPDGRALVTGRSATASQGFDYVTIRYNETGNRQKILHYDGPDHMHDHATGAIMDLQGNMIVTGASKSIINGYDYRTVKYDTSGAQSWSATYDGPVESTDQVVGMAFDPSGNLFVVGNYGPAEVVKYDPAGKELWRTSRSRVDFEKATCFAVDDTGNLYLAGGEGWTGFGHEKYFVIKYDTNGAQQWEQNYDIVGNKADEAKAIAVDNNGFVYVTGLSESTPTAYDIATIKLRAGSGGMEWPAVYSTAGAFNDEPAAIVVDAAGNVMVAGSSDAGANGNDILAIQYNSNGAQVWEYRYDGPTNGQDEARGMLLDPSNDIYVFGTSDSAGFTDIYLARIDNAGNELWTDTYKSGLNADDLPGAIALDGGGNLYVTGQVNGSVLVLLKYNAVNGSREWAETYSSHFGFDRGNALALDQPGNIYVAGIGRGPGSNGIDDYLIQRYHPTGLLQWTRFYNGPAGDADEALAILLNDDATDIFVTGNSIHIPYTNVDFATIKLDQCPTIPYVNFMPSEDTACQNDSLHFSNESAGATSFTWSVNGNQESTATDFSRIFTQDTLYHISLTGSDGTCADTTAREIIIHPSPTVNIYTAGATTFCTGDSILLESDPGFAAYHWSTADTSPNIYVHTMDTFSVMVTDQNNCNAWSDLVFTDLDTMPTATISPQGPIMICPGDSILLSGSTGKWQYYWSTGDTTPGISVKNEQAYLLTVSNSCGDDHDTVQVQMDSLPIASITPPGPQMICEGDSIFLTGMSGSWSNAWNTGDTTPGIYVLEPQAYILTVSNLCGTDEDSVQVMIDSLPVAGFSYQVNDGGVVEFTDDSRGATSWEWDFGDGNLDTMPSPIHSYASNGIYIVSLISSNDCGDDTLVQEVLVSTLGIDDQARRLRLYPVPADRWIRIQLPSSPGVYLSIYDITGRQLVNEYLNPGKQEGMHTIQVSTWPDGFYYLRIKTPRGVSERKIIISR